MSTHQEASPVFLESQSVVPAPCDLAPPIAKVPVHTPGHKHHLHKSQDTTPQFTRHLDGWGALNDSSNI